MRTRLRRLVKPRCQWCWWRNEMEATQLTLSELTKGPGQVEDIKIRLDELPTWLPGPNPTPEFSKTVLDNGVISPISLRKVNGAWEVLDGKRRVKAARAIGLEVIPARVFTNGFYSEVLSLVLNAQRSANPAFEYEAIQALLEKGATEQLIVSATGMDVGTIRKRLKLASLLPDLFLALQAGRINYPLADRIATLPVSEQTELLEIYREEGKLTGTDVKLVTRARHDKAQMDLGDLFNPVESTWQFRVKMLLEQAAAIAEDVDVKADITKLALAV